MEKELRKRLVKCFVLSVALYGAEIWKHLKCVNMEKDGACKIETQNKKCKCTRKSERMKNNAGTDKE